MFLSTAISEFIQTKQDVERLSENTIALYKITLGRLLQHFQPNDPNFTEIQTEDIRAFMAAQTQLTNASLLRYFSDLSSLWTWATQEKGLTDIHILRRIKPPRPEQNEIIPFTETEIKTLLGLVGLSRPYTRKNLSTPYTLKPEGALRNQAIILTLLDTGLRASELCSIRVKDIRLGQRGVHLVTVWGKGSKQRLVGLSARTHEVLWSYLACRGVNPSDKDSLVFMSAKGNPLNRDALRLICARLGQRAGIPEVHPHRFRHTFAIEFLRNGGDSFTLQKILGHSTLDMVKRYLAIAQIDIERNHAKASVVTNWGL